MNTFQKINHWSESHHSIWFDFTRIIVGLCIFIKGFYFTQKTDGFRKILSNTRLEFLSPGIEHYMVFSLLVGGLLIALGLKTRIAIALQLPVIFGELISITENKSWYIAPLFTLVLLLFYLVYGSGKLSMDEYMRTHSDV